MANALKNFNVIITGGTGSLGREITAEFIKYGATVYTNYRTAQKFEDLKKFVPDAKNLAGYEADLTVESQVKDFFRKFEADFKRLDVFLHIMGGFWMGGEIADTPVEKWNHMINLNLNSAFLCSREAFRIMKVQCSGKIFTVSTKNAEEFPAKMGAYAVSKAAVLALTRILANEGKAYDIHANCLLPSVIDTSANRKAMPNADRSAWVTPKEIADLLVQLCRPEVKSLSHSNLKVYGKL
jgi:NAD(P)-dependent dehydrogenase (short-subunit alcohol dehydrogenase family)